MTPTPDAPAARRPGRPRAAARAGSGDPVEEILAATGRLIGEKGVGATTMAAIARAVGLKQSSLYYYFRRKEEIVAALVARANVVPLALARSVVDEGGPASVQLHRFVRADVVAMCTLPFDINEIHRIAARDRVEFASYWSERATLEGHLEAIVARGVAEGDLRPVDARLAAVTLLSDDEATQNWFRLGTDVAPEVVAAHLAATAVGGLLAEGRRLDEVVVAAGAMDAAHPGDDGA